jgi:regulator of sigma E protease
MEILSGYLIPFLVVLTVLVFVHEFGHYIIARWNGVRVEVFSIGFGPEIFGWNDKAGTRWKFSAIPLGGYVKMFGDANAASQPDAEGAEQMSAAERAVAFPHKRLGQRAAIVVAGPAANFLFAIVVLAGLFMISGQPYTAPVVDQVREQSAAAAAGLQPGDRIVQLDGQEIERFEELQRIVRLSPGETMSLVVQRAGERVQMTATPERSTVTDSVGTEHTIGLLGVTSTGMEYKRFGPFESVLRAGEETYALTTGTLQAVGQIIAGSRSTDELGGPIRIAQLSGQVADTGVTNIVWFMAVLSINLGLINLFPVPMLDGGHLMFYAIEAVRGRPLGEKAQDIGFKIGLACVLALMIFATFNDLKHIFT